MATMSLSIVTFKMLEFRIESLVSKGKEICKQYKPDESSSFNSVSCKECGYTSDTHLLRDILKELKGEQ